MDNKLQFLIFLLKACGGDIVAPAGLRELATKNTNMEDNKALSRCMEVMDNVEDQDEKLKIISILIWTQLLPSKMLQIHDSVHTGMEAHLKWLKIHPEDRAMDEHSLKSTLETLLENE